MRITPNPLFLALSATLLLAACGPTPDVPSGSLNDAPADDVAAASDADAQAAADEAARDDMVDPLDAILAGDWRDPKNVPRDAWRHPRETLAFFGVGASQRIIEIAPGGGWYTEILAPLATGKGSYVGVLTSADSFDDDKTRQFYAEMNTGLRAKLAAREDVYGRATLIEIDPATPVLGEPGSADAVLTFRNVHNWTDDGVEKQMFQAFFDVLAPGGVLGVVDHRAAAGRTLEDVKGSGYVPTDYVIQIATDAGFVLEEQSEINANPNDTKDHPNGVWTLPPVNAHEAADDAKYAAIGESDRMTLRFRKPSAAP